MDLAKQRILDDKKCLECGHRGFRIVDKRNNKTICITCGSPMSSSAQHDIKVDKKEVCEGNKQRKTTSSRKVNNG